jgi:hypothetical protein
VRLKIAPQSGDRNWQAAAAQYATPAYPAFCDRLELLQSLSVLLASAAGQRALGGRGNDLQALAMYVRQSDGAIDSPRLGRTWTLRAMAAEAIRAGHLPCLLINNASFGAMKKWPATLAEFLQLLRRTMTFTATTFALTPPAWRAMNALDDMEAGDPLPDALKAEFRDIYAGDPQEGVVRARRVCSTCWRFSRSRRFPRRRGCCC